MRSHSYIAVDPGIDTGWALFDVKGDLEECGLGDVFPFRTSAKVVIEKPEIYAARFMKGNPNDLITLAIRVGRYQQVLEQRGNHCEVKLVLPKTWKGQVPKEIMAARTLQSLSEKEKEVFMVQTKGITKSKMHNVWDAVALGKWAIKTGLWG